MDRTIDQLKEASLSNDAEAQWELAICYAQGNGVEQSDAKAFEWICRAAENGKEEAENYVINAYENGSEELGIQPDMDKLAEWADKLSENGSAAMRIKYADLAMERKSNNINFVLSVMLQSLPIKGISPVHSMPLCLVGFSQLYMMITQ